MNLHEEIISLRSQGMRPCEISKRLKVTKGVVAGALYRAGMTERTDWRSRPPLPPQAQKPHKNREPRPAGSMAEKMKKASWRRMEAQRLYDEGKTYAEIGAAIGVVTNGVSSYVLNKRRRNGILSTKKKSADVRLAALTRFYAGESYDSIAKALNVSKGSIRSWRLIPDLDRASRSAGEALYAERQAAEAEIAAQASMAREAERADAESGNAEILARMPDRHRLIVLGRLSGKTLQEVGDEFCVTRERIRQIVNKWRLRGLVIFEAPELTDAVRNSRVMNTSERRGRTAKERPPKEKRERPIRGKKPVGRPPGKYGSYNISPEDRERRSARMKAMWSKARDLTQQETG